MIDIAFCYCRGVVELRADITQIRVGLSLTLVIIRTSRSMCAVNVRVMGGQVLRCQRRLFRTSFGRLMLNV